MKTRVQPRVHNEPAIFRTKEEYVADFLRAAILSGEIARGTRLKQADLAAHLGLSITPVREALKLLAAEGFVHGATHRGALVAPFEITAAAEVVELRALLEARLTVSAMRRMTLGEMESFERLAEEFEQAAETAHIAAARAANYRFHRFLFSLADEALTSRFVNVLWAKYPFDILHDLEGRVGRAAREHARLIDAVISRNEEAAANATREHIYAGWQELAAAIAAKPAAASTSDHRKLSNPA